MQRELFIEGLKDIKEISKDEMYKIIERSVQHNASDGNPLGHRNSIIVMEELCELGQQISKQIRNRGNKYDLLEELADVQIGLMYIQSIYDISDEDLHKALCVKFKRLSDFIDNNPDTLQ